jgi:hypothetical protein
MNRGEGIQFPHKTMADVTVLAVPALEPRGHFAQSRLAFG